MKRSILIIMGILLVIGLLAGCGGSGGGGSKKDYGPDEGKDIDNTIPGDVSFGVHGAVYNMILSPTGDSLYHVSNGYSGELIAGMAWLDGTTGWPAVISSSPRNSIGFIFMHQNELYVVYEEKAPDAWGNIILVRLDSASGQEISRKIVDQGHLWDCSWDWSSQEFLLSYAKESENKTVIAQVDKQGALLSFDISPFLEKFTTNPSGNIFFAGNLPILGDQSCIMMSSISPEWSEQYETPDANVIHDLVATDDVVYAYGSINIGIANIDPPAPKNGIILKRDAATGELLKEWLYPDEDIAQLALDSDGNIYAIRSGKLFRINADETSSWEISIPSSNVRAFCVKGSYVAVGYPANGGKDTKVILYDTATGTQKEE